MVCIICVEKEKILFIFINFFFGVRCGRILYNNGVFYLLYNEMIKIKVNRVIMFVDKIGNKIINNSKKIVFNYWSVYNSV